MLSLQCRRGMAAWRQPSPWRLVGGLEAGLPSAGKWESDLRSVRAEACFPLCAGLLTLYLVRCMNHHVCAAFTSLCALRAPWCAVYTGSCMLCAPACVRCLRWSVWQCAPAWVRCVHRPVCAVYTAGLGALCAPAYVRYVHRPVCAMCTGLCALCALACVRCVRRPICAACANMCAL